MAAGVPAIVLLQSTSGRDLPQALAIACAALLATGGAIMLASTAAQLPMLIAGPTLAFAAGIAGWAVAASRTAPRAANDNAPRRCPTPPRFATESNDAGSSVGTYGLCGVDPTGTELGL